MANMSYCRFQNTRIDLQDCADELYQMTEDGGTLSRAEEEAFGDMLETVANMIELFSQTTGLDYMELLDRLGGDSRAFAKLFLKTCKETQDELEDAEAGE